MNFLLIGRPNVGKSSIYNILTGKKLNIVHNDIGTTRDWHKENIKNLTHLSIFDTPGLHIDKNSIKVLKKNLLFKKLLNNINYILYVVDYKSLFNDLDCFSINYLRKYNKKIFLLINKFDNINSDPSNEFLKYGIDKIFFLSCSHNYGFKNLNNFFKKNFSLKNNNLENNKYKIAIFGKPNVGKSTFLNSVLGYERSNTDKNSGTTSDFVKENSIFDKNIFSIIDTAGIDRKSKIINKSIQHYSIKKSIEQIPIVNVAIIMIDSKSGIDRQDKRIIELVYNKSKNILIVFNKIDLIKNKSKFRLDNILSIKQNLMQIKNIKIFFCSSFLKKDINNIIKYIFNNLVNNKIAIKTNNLNKWLDSAIKIKSHPLIQGKKVKFKYVVQINESPITIKIFCNYSSKIKSDYKRFLNNNFNKYFKILNQKTKFIFTSTKNPYSNL